MRAGSLRSLRSCGDRRAAGLPVSRVRYTLAPPLERWDGAESLLLPPTTTVGTGDPAPTQFVDSRGQMTLLELTAEEDRLLEAVSRVTGSMEERASKLRRAGVSAAYAEVHSAYVLLAEKEGAVEALKRAVFLQWYLISEPGCFTALLEMDAAAERRALDLLDGLVARGEFDEEFQWMAAYYFRVTDFYLPGHEGLEALKEFSRRNQGELWSRGAPSRASLSGRGQMSAYWLSIRHPRAAV